MMMLQHISPHFAATGTSGTASSSGATKSSSTLSSSSGEESPGTSHERSPSPTEQRSTPSPQNSAEDTRSRSPMTRSDQSCDESSDDHKFEPRRKMKTAAMKKEMDVSPIRRSNAAEDADGEEEQDEDRSRPSSRCESPPAPEILTHRVSISQKLCDKLNGAIIRRALKQEQEQRERDPVVVLNHQRLLMRERMETSSPPMEEDEEEDEEDTDSNVPLDLSLNAEEKMKREQTERFLREHKKDDGSESDDSGGPGEDRGRAYKKSLMKRYCEYPGARDRVSIY